MRLHKSLKRLQHVHAAGRQANWRFASASLHIHCITPGCIAYAEPTQTPQVLSPDSGASTFTEKPTLDMPLELRLLYSDLQQQASQPKSDTNLC
jgi:hypothetical protein